MGFRIAKREGRCWWLLALLTASLFIVSCAKSNPRTRPNFGFNGTPGANGVIIDNSVPADQRALLEGDLQLLSSVQVSEPNRYVEYLGIPDFSASNLSDWLADRVRVVVGESYDYKTNAVKGESRRYDPHTLERSKDELSKVVTVMFNLGAYLYLDGRDSSRLYNLALAGANIPITSPRVGIIQIGEGLFSEASTIGGSSPSSLANRLVRLAVLFHEARHGDGNGTNAAFPHAKCTMQGSYYDKNACEANLNGPYVVEAVMLWHFYTACKGCTSTELEGISAFVADNMSRLQGGAKIKDARPESL